MSLTDKEIQETEQIFFTRVESSPEKYALDWKGDTRPLVERKYILKEEILDYLKETSVVQVKDISNQEIARDVEQIATSIFNRIDKVRAKQGRGEELPPPPTTEAEEAALTAQYEEKFKQDAGIISSTPVIGSILNAARAAASAISPAAAGLLSIAPTANTGATRNIFGDEITPSSIETAAAARQNRLSEQAALILTLDELLPKIQKTDALGNVLNVKQKLYKNFAPIRYKNELQTPTGHYFLTNYFTKPSNINMLFQRLPPQVLSFLLPSVKMYKVFYPDELSGKKGFEWRIPFDNVPAKYANESSEFVAQDIDKILSGESGLHSVGIKSFKYELKGVNPAETNTNIRASLELLFQNPAELIKEIAVPWDDARFVEKPNMKYQNITFSYSDLINSVTKMCGDNKFNDKYYRIKIECGFADIQTNILKDLLSSAGFGDDEANQLIAVIRSIKVSLFLMPYEYDIDFKDDTTVSLKINYIAAADSMMFSSEADLFSITEEAKQLEEITKQYERFLFVNKEQNIEASERSTDPNLTPEEQKKSVEEFLAKHPELRGAYSEEKVLESLWKERAKAYNSIYRFLVGQESIHDQGKTPYTISPKIYVAKFKPDILGITSKDSQNKAKKRIEASKQGQNVVSVEPIFEDDEELAVGTYADATNGSLTKNIDDKTNEYYSSNRELYNIKFVLLGDILDVALETLNKLEPAKDAPKVVIGNIPISLPEKIENDYGTYFIASLKEVNPNLADIPISLNLFQEFMVKHVVESKKQRYPVLQFLKDIISELIIPAVGPSVLGRSTAINSSIRFSNAHFTLPVYGGEDKLSRSKPEVRNYLPHIDEAILNELKRIRTDNALAADKGEQTNYLFIVCSGKTDKYLGIADTPEAIQKFDEENGIVHLRMGTETGIVNKIQFSRVALPYQREMLAQREGKGQGTVLKQFYNANVTMMGNNIFRPGDYVYIHPNYTFVNHGNNVSARIDLEEKLGIGGYYSVIDVQTEINDMQFKTHLQCTFQSQTKKKEDEKKAKTVCVPTK